MKRTRMAVAAALVLLATWVLVMHLAAWRAMNAPARAAPVVGAGPSPSSDPGARDATARETIANNVTANLRDAIRRYGPASKQAREIYSFANGICSDIELNPQERPAQPGPDRAWAWAKLDAECAQFRAQTWSPALAEWNGTPDLVMVWLKQDEASATRLAIASMDEDIELGRLLQGGTWLLERGNYPHQAEYGDMTHEQLWNAFNLAARLRTCSAINACGPGAIQTAAVCARVGCPPGVSFVDAMRRQLTQGEYEVALKMRDALARDAHARGAR